ncbi:hypothetical protein [Candidatus Palauibacter sp.]|uniref:hypothetical protein n=1 Tax=Candidatus Palauibacter sp. TaxID=3101350 RepID=UPI003B58F69A
MVPTQEAVVPAGNHADLVDAIVTAVEASFDARFNELLSAVLGLREGFASLRDRFLDLRDHMDQRIGMLEERVGAVGNRVGGLEQKVGAVQQRIGALEQRTGTVERRIAELDVPRRQVGFSPPQP